MPILVLAFLWHYLWVALPRHYLSIFEGGSRHCVAPASAPAPPLMRLALIINCIIGFACCLLCPRQLVREGSLGCPWGRDAADGVLTELPDPPFLCPIPVAPTANAASQWGGRGISAVRCPHTN